MENPTDEAIRDDLPRGELRPIAELMAFTTSNGSSSVTQRPPEQRPRVTPDEPACGRCGRPGHFDDFGQLVQHGCCRCDDLGFVVPARGADTSHLCDCRKAASARPGETGEQAVERIGLRIPVHFLTASLESFEPDTSPERAAVNEYVSSWPPVKPFLVLSSQTKGVGKTHLACAVLRAVRRRWDVEGAFYNVPSLIDRYRAASSPETAYERVQDIDRELTRCPLLVLDDMGVGKQTEFVEERLYRQVDERYGRHLPLVVTTNAWGQIEERTQSRLGGSSVSTVVMFSGRDAR